MSEQNQDRGTTVEGAYYLAAIKFDQLQAKNMDLPAWLRVAHYARANQGVRSCESRQSRAELCRTTGAKNPARAVTEAVKYGYLREGSSAECLKLAAVFVDRKRSARGY